jgi:hypothetical protein
MKFEKATKKEAKARVALCGPPGSGKTYTGLSIAQGLGKKIAVIDTERKSASKYSDLFEFDVLELETFSPDTYVEAIQTAEAAGYDVLLIDSLSHAWIGKDGALEQVDKAKGDRGNSFNAWRNITPMHNRLVEAMLRCKSHLIVTMRVKTEYVVEVNDKGKSVPRKVGLAPVQRDGLEYEFDVVGDLDNKNYLTITKSRCPSLTDRVKEKPGAELGQELLAWLSDGVKVTETTETWYADLVKKFESAQNEGELTAVRHAAQSYRSQMTPGQLSTIMAASSAAKARLQVVA